MKSLTVFIFIFGMSQSAFSQSGSQPKSGDQVFSCEVTDTDKKYDDIFIVTASENKASQIEYKRRYSCNPIEGYSALEPIRGCTKALLKTKKTGSNAISLECDMDGEEGMVTIDPVTMTGEIYFFMPKIGYGERTLLDIKCEKIK
jgi:hypothetical protein